MPTHRILMAAAIASLGAGATPLVAAPVFLINANSGVNAREDGGFGYDISTSGTRIAIGEPGGISASAPTVVGGAVEIWRREGASAVREQRIVAPQPIAFSGFGAVVRMSGEWLAVTSFDPPTLELYRRSGNTWQHGQTLVANPPGPGYLPWLLDLDGDWLVAGSMASGMIQIPLQAYRLGDDAWAMPVPVTGLDTLPGDQFGASGALARGRDGMLRLAIGAPLRSEGRGAVYVFAWDGASWQQEQRLQLGTAQIEENLGRSVALNGDSLIAGAPGFDAGAQLDGSGRAAIWRRSGSGDFPWQPSAILTLDEPAANDRFGASVALPTPRLALVGAPDRDIPVPPLGDAVDAGSALRYTFDATPTDCAPGWVHAGGIGPPSLPQSGARHGWIVAGGDLLAAGAFQASVNSIPRAGRVSLSLDDTVFRYGHDCRD